MHNFDLMIVVMVELLQLLKFCIKCILFQYFSSVLLEKSDRKKKSTALEDVSVFLQQNWKGKLKQDSIFSKTFP